jgi:hypothetical protein
MNSEHLIEREITGDVIGAFYEVYNQLGFGFLEVVYALALEKGVAQARSYGGKESECSRHLQGGDSGESASGYGCRRQSDGRDQSTETLHPKARRLTLNYLRSTPLEVGLRLHFGPEAHFYRFVNFK